ncbi:MAG: hypothetical protein OHK0017_01740 [Patescibacteria group bacterium]
MNVLKYLIGGILVVVLRGLYDVFMGGKFELTQQNITAYAITTLIAMVSFAIADQLVKSK